MSPAAASTARAFACPPLEKLAGTDVEQRRQGVWRACVRVRRVENDHGNSRGAGALDVFPDRVRIGARDTEAIDTGGDGVVEEVGHVLDGEGGTAQPLHVDAVALAGILHAGDDDVPEGIAGASMGDEGEVESVGLLGVRIARGEAGDEEAGVADETTKGETQGGATPGRRDGCGVEAVGST